MGKHDRKGRSKDAKLPWASCHVELNNGFRQEAAWKGLKASARVVYVELKSLYNGFNNGKVMASERHLAKLTGLGKNTVSRALGGLQEAGFIVQMQRGVLGIDGKGNGTLWRLTEIGCLGERPTKDFKKWDQKNRTLPPKWTQGAPKMDPVNAASAPKMDPGCPQNGGRKAPKTAHPCPQNGPNLIDVPEGAGKTATGTAQIEGEFLDEPRRFAVVLPGGAVRRVGTRIFMNTTTTLNSARLAQT